MGLQINDSSRMSGSVNLKLDFDRCHGIGGDQVEHRIGFLSLLEALVDMCIQEWAEVRVSCLIGL